MFSVLLGNAPSDQSADQTAGGSAGSGPCESCCDRSPNNETYTRNDELGSDSRDTTDDGAECSADRTAGTCAFECLDVVRHHVRIFIIFVACCVRHYHVDVIIRITSVAQ